MIRRLATTTHNQSGAAILTDGPSSTPTVGIALPRSPSDDIPFLTAVLEAHRAPAQLTERLIAAVAKLPSRYAVADRLGAALADEIPFAPLSDVLRAPALLLLGPPGAGKTTLAAKLAARLGEDGDGNALLVNADPDRAGSIAQLAEYSDVLGLPLAVAADAAALGELVAGAGERRIIIDTKGTAPSDSAGCAALAALVAASGATPLLVLPADSAAEEAAAMAHCFAPLGARTLLPTRLDLVRRLGGVLAAADAGRMKLSAVGVTPQFAYGLRPLTPALLARQLISGAAAVTAPHALATSV
jgi:flagellar biosynthesis protein FlhF